MYELTIGNLFRIVFKSILIALLLSPLFAIAYYLIHININFAYHISSELNIPRDLALTPMSAGFANNIIILSSVFEFGFGCWLINKLTKTKLFENISNFIKNL